MYPAELRLPPGALLTLVIRGGVSLTPDRDTSLRVGDELLIVAPAGTRRATDARLAAVASAGKLAGWHNGESPAVR